MNKAKDKALTRHKSYKTFIEKGKEIGKNPTIKTAFVHGFNSGFKTGAKWEKSKEPQEERRLFKGGYCCKYMKESDEKEIIDYCPPNLTTLDVKKEAFPIYFCPFCGREIEGSKKFVRKLKRQVKGIEDGTIKTIPLKDLKITALTENLKEKKQ